ncbi:transmembrane protein 8a [Plakobranchus ocellatus]|uniref:Transmembrane protein 8a n=1 Tax=Plakobranchus ocellatus TaxID=259542 RepID=A0AAV4B196_9GAST|nr:transmembrane protein 8a [Plakobranchus ocellatus]
MSIYIMQFQRLIVAICAVFSLAAFLSTDAWPQPSESINWELRRNLVEYKMYAAVHLGRIDIPLHTLAINISIAVERNDKSCQVKVVNLYASMSGIPVVSRDGETFPNNTYVNASAVHNMTILSNNETVVWVLEKVSPGSLMLMAVMPKPDSRIKQKGLGRSCGYYLTTRARVIHYKEEEIDQLPINVPIIVKMEDKPQQILSFWVPLDSIQYEVEIHGCDRGKGSCPVNISVWEHLTPDIHGPGQGHCVWVNGSCTLQLTAPLVHSLNYIIISASKDANHSMTVLIKTSQCMSGPRPNTTEIHYHELPSKKKKLSSSSSETNDAVQACSFAGQLGRETPARAAEGSSFFDHFVAWDEEIAPHTIISEKVSDVNFLVRRFSLRTTDTGSSLRIDVQISSDEDDDEKNNVNASFTQVDLCLSLQRIVSPKTCQTGKSLQLSTKQDIHKHHVIVPYPTGGVWYISMQSTCFHEDNNTSKDVAVPCMKPIGTNLTIHLAPCIDGGCGQYGSCNLYLGGGLLYSACDCFSGWRGYGCNDGSQAESAATEKLAVYLLTLSNLAFLPGIILAFYRRFYIEALVYIYNMFFSTFYHACDTSRIYQLCILEYNTLSFADFFASLMSFWVTLMAMAYVPAYPRAVLHVCGAVLIALGEVHNRHGLLEQMLPLVVGIAVMLLSWGFESYRRRKLFPSRSRLLKFILPGVVLAVVGLVLNLALETKENYKYVHSTWHVLEAMSICFLLPPHTSSSGRRKDDALSIQSGDISQRPLVGNSGDEDSALAQVTFQRADQMDRDGGDSQPNSSPETTSGVVQNGLRLHNRNNRRRDRNLIL